ncbi:MAG: DUF2799 domain-containing protein [Gammaproteobacteria bacterium]|nr:DUF2799 domain-containing protein [Gammaproteobacteria bacterium]
MLTLASALFMSGCATMSADECLSSDWQAIGFEDGSRGYTADRIGYHRKACGKHGVAPDLQEYQAGRAEGLREFCQPQRGFNLGAGGGQYNGVCPAELEGDFLDAFRTGAQLHTLRSNVNSANYQINARDKEIKQIKEEMRAKEVALISKDTPVEERVLILADLKELSERTGQLEQEIEQLVADRAVHEEQLASYEALLASSGY